METLRVATRAQREMVDITAQVVAAVAKRDVREGICLVYSPHTTAALTINENYDPDVRTDLTGAFSDLMGDERRFRHAEGNSGAHALTSLVGPSIMIPIGDGSLALGQWQGIFLVELDGPRQRSVHVQVLRDAGDE